MRIGFIGLGLMGQGMALNLCRAGYDLVVHDLNRASGAALEEAGATWAASVAELADSADVAFTSLPGPVEMRQVGVGDGGLLSALKPGSAWFDLTTNSPTVVREVHASCREHGVELFDAPVSGGPKGARSGKLAIYVGGDREAFDRVGGVLDAIGDQILYVGEIGAGNTAKLVHNCASMTIRSAIAEVFTMGVKAGVEPGPLWHAMRQGAIGRARTFDRVGDRYLQEAFDPPSFALVLANKDLRLALELADQLDVPMRAARLVQEDFQEALDRGWGNRDSQTPLLLQNERAGVTIKLSADEVQAVLDRGRPAHTPTQSGDDMSTADAADVKATGRRIMNELMGDGYVEKKDGNRNSFNDVIQDYSEEVCFGRVWARDGIDRKTRSIVNLAMLTAVGRPAQLAHHVEGAISNGCTVAEIKEVLLQTAVYCGLPAAGEAFKVAEGVLRAGGHLD
jgi:3-hydroxyisobutyrate dehydrogenase